MLKKLNKKNAIEYVIILIITLLLCQNFIQMHYSSDTYVLYELGYMKYPSKYFLLDGRLVSTLVCYLAGILNIPISAYIIGMNLIGIILIATAIYILSKVIENLIKPEKIITKAMIIASSFVLILNQFTLEFLVFPESAVMCLGVFLCVLSIKMMIEKPKHEYLKIFIALLIAGLCYQGVLNIFPVLAILVYIVKEIVDKREYKVKEKEFFIDMIKLAVIVITVLVICMLAVKVGTTLLNSKQDRRMHLISFEAVQLRGETVAEYMDELWNQNMHMLPTHFSTIVLIINFIMLIVLKTKKELIMQYLLLVFVAFAICIVPMFLFNTGVCGRVNVPLMMLWGASLIVMLAQSTQIESNIKKNIVYFIIVASFVINNIFIMQNITEHIAANRVDENTGKTIKYALEKYEKESGIKVTKFSYTYDKNPQQHATGIKPLGSLTERKFACSWCILQAVEFYCERDFQLVRIPRDVYEEKIPKGDFTEFSEEQLIFDGDALYMMIY